MAEMKHPHIGGVVDVRDEDVERFEAAGYVKVQQSKPRRKSKSDGK